MKHARAALGVGKVAIVDWDVDHGNGAQAIFGEDREVSTFLHEDRFFPANSGLVEDRGVGAGRGTLTSRCRPALATMATRTPHRR